MNALKTMPVGGLALIILTACVCEQREAPVVVIPSAHQLDTGPMAFFEQHCAECHGEGGTNYGEAFAGLSDRALQVECREMVDGFTEATISADTLDALVAMHRALLDNRPFLVVTSMTAGRLSGEVTAGASVVVQCDGILYTARVDGYTWEAEVAPDSLSHLFGCDVTATHDGESTTVVPGLQSWSHAEAP